MHSHDTRHYGQEEHEIDAWDTGPFTRLLACLLTLFIHLPCSALLALLPRYAALNTIVNSSVFCSLTSEGVGERPVPLTKIIWENSISGSMGCKTTMAPYFYDLLVILEFFKQSQPIVRPLLSLHDW